ncbi:response regulator transcription factor [Conexibacter arvalis]|uniref:DNA-binding response OmpR family regulator n=1 Tax=Conexibacter arvalis TaxID=912552 RepID=A0A840II39_9ACTN|nr:response regulator transcription factor [Conexibacter arvalis]MBB4664727.1 DNA-binding response OmpR family regulator [Conexibacter arvalis]
MNDARSTILVVEDDRNTRSFLVDNLAADGYELICATTVEEALTEIGTSFPDLVLLDLSLPDRDGLELLHEVRSSDGLASRIDPALPLLVISGRASELNRIRTIERGADDMLGKPFSYPELRARIGALLRRSEQRTRRGLMRVGPLEVDPAGRTAHLHGRRVPLSQKEFALLRTLASDPTRVYTKDELLRNIWGYRHLGSTRTLDSHACRLRQKLSTPSERWVVNVWGVGYRLLDGVVEQSVEDPAPPVSSERADDAAGEEEGGDRGAEDDAAATTTREEAA